MSEAWKPYFKLYWLDQYVGVCCGRPHSTLHGSMMESYKVASDHMAVLERQYDAFPDTLCEFVEILEKHTDSVRWYVAPSDITQRFERWKKLGRLSLVDLSVDVIVRVWETRSHSLVTLESPDLTSTLEASRSLKGYYHGYDITRGFVSGRTVGWTVIDPSIDPEIPDTRSRPTYESILIRGQEIEASRTASTTRVSLIDME